MATEQQIGDVELDRLLHELCDAQYAAGDWRDGDDEPWVSVFAKVGEAHAAFVAAQRRQRVPEMLAALRDLLAYEAEQFDGDPDSDLSVSGADLVDWFTEFRNEVHTLVRTIEGQTQTARE